MIQTFTLLLLLSFTCALSAQQILPRKTLCIPDGEGFIADLFSPNDLGTDEPFTTSTYRGACLEVDANGGLYFVDNPEEGPCCGDSISFEISALIGAEPAAGFPGETFAILPVTVFIKCPKPDCGTVDIDPLNDSNPRSQNRGRCLNACENSLATYRYDALEGEAYVWTATNAAVIFDPGNPAEVLVEWGAAPTGSLTVEVLNASGGLAYTHTYCVDINPSPVADFSAPGEVCLDQTVYFDNTSTGPPASYDWDFGDGTSAQNTPNPTHTYTSPGTYEVTLFATSNNFDPERRGGCCCTDSISYTIEVSNLPGPNIYWVSTLCEGDESVYWTDAPGCTGYGWSTSANGTITSGLGTDTITVAWTDGPSGTITLAADCGPGFCDQPVSVRVPIITNDGPITGPTEVCINEVASYQLPKWMTVNYDWSVSAGFIAGPNTGEAITVNWNTAPGTYTVSAAYGSDFLAGLPNHDAGDCAGSDAHTVTVLDEFNLTAAPDPACVGGSTTIFANSVSGAAYSYNWSVTGPGTVAGGSGPSFTANWPVPGTYTVTADAQTAASFCVPTKTIMVTVREAVQPVLTGPTDFCAGDSLVFNVANPLPGYLYTWSATGGSISNGQGSPTATVEFGAVATAEVSVTGKLLGSPFCESDPAAITLTTIQLIGSPQISNAPACTNEELTYTIDVAQHPSATYDWFIMPPEAGSIVAGGASPSVQVQWNAAAGAVQVGLDLTVCGQTTQLTRNLTLTDATVPVIDVTGNDCPDAPTTLSVSGSFGTYAWSTGATTASITTTVAGTYSVTTTDANGCTGVGAVTYDYPQGPLASVTNPGNSLFCVSATTTPYVGTTLSAITNTGVSFQWYLNGNPIPGATGSTYDHTVDNTVASYDYRVAVTDANGCTVFSKITKIDHTLCGGTGCDNTGLARVQTTGYTPDAPYCDTLTLEASFAGDSVDVHRFLSNADFTTIATGGSVASGTVTQKIKLDEVGCVAFYSYIAVWDYTLAADGSVIDSVECFRQQFFSVCNPMLADFSFSGTCGDLQFTDASLVDPAQVTPGSLTYAWDFGDNVGTSTVANPNYQYAANGTYTVELIISDGSCASRYVETVVVDDIPDANFSFAPATACAGELITFTPAPQTDIIEWRWRFGDGSELLQEVGQKTYNPSVPTNYDVTLIMTSAAGCVDSTTQTLTVNPAPAVDTIEATNGLIICTDETTVLSVDAVAGHSYVWSNGDIGPVTNVSSAGAYEVTVSNSFGCQRVIGPVEVQVVPEPDVTISGDLVLCGTGDVNTLTATAGGGFSFQWRNLSNPLLPVGTGRTYDVSYFGMSGGVQNIELTVTNNDFGCENTTTYTVLEAPLPDVTLSLTGSACAGEPNTLTIVNVDPNVNYAWSNGATGPTTTTTLAGSISVTATNVSTGCTATGFAFINPLPDVCSVPTGCYTTCKPDTLTAPAGPYTYSWTFNGTQLGTGDELIVSESGEYVLTVVDVNTGCSSTTEPLILEVIDCSETPPTDCEDIVTKLEPATVDKTSCCYTLSYADLPADAFYVEITSADAELTVHPGSVNPAIGYVGATLGGGIQLALDNSLSGPLPTSLGNLLIFCPANASASPQVVLVRYFDKEGNEICKVELETDCAVEPDCVYVAADTLTCTKDRLVELTVEVCVPASSTYAIAYLEFKDASPTASPLLPASMTLVPALAPGECRTITLPAAALTPGDELCYRLVAHSADPKLDPAALCCSNEEVRCLKVPDCDPCDNLSVDVKPLEEGDCCYNFFLFDGADAFEFAALEFCLLDANAGASISMLSTLGSGFVADNNGAVITVKPSDGGALPSGAFEVPTICLDGSNAAENLVEVKWIDASGVACRDTVSLFCEPDCGYLKPEKFACDGGQYVWSGSIVNTSDHTMNEAYVDFPTGYDAYDVSVSFPAIAPGATAFVSFVIGAPAQAGEEICVDIILHEVGDDEGHENCCRFETCLELPDCEITDCNCDQLDEEVALGFDIAQGTTPGTYTFSSIGAFGKCDELLWEIRNRNPVGNWESIGKTNPLTHTFTGKGLYDVRLTVVRFDADGRRCANASVLRRLEAIPADDEPSVNVYPNPAREVLHLKMSEDINEEQFITLRDLHGKVVRSYPVRKYDAASEVLDLPLRGVIPGIYFLHGEQDDESWVKRVIVQ